MPTPGEAHVTDETANMHVVTTRSNTRRKTWLSRIARQTSRRPPQSTISGSIEQHWTALG